MEIITSQENFEKAGYKDLIELKCLQCHKVFLLAKRCVVTNICSNRKHNNQDRGKFCSRECISRNQSDRGRKEVFCLQCNKQFRKKLSQITQSPKHFCSSYCSGVYNSSRRTYKPCGAQRSKLEIFIEAKLKSLYPNIDFYFNRRDAIGLELDIYIPSLKLAFEINGPIHYEAIFGLERLESAQRNDLLKIQLCSENQIELYPINTSSTRQFKESSANIYLDRIIDLIKDKMNLI